MGQREEILWVKDLSFGDAECRKINNPRVVGSFIQLTVPIDFKSITINWAREAMNVVRSY